MSVKLNDKISKLPILVVSLKDSNGRSTVIQALFPPGATCPWHYHTDYQETFHVLEGEFKVYIGDEEFILQKGQSAPAINRKQIHRFKNNSSKEVAASITFEPGHVGNENSILILAGLEREGKYDLLTRFKGYNVTWLVFYDITNTILTGIPRLIFRILRLFYGRTKILKVRQEYLSKYCNNNNI